MKSILLGFGLVLSFNLSAQTYIRPIKMSSESDFEVVTEQKKNLSLAESWAPYETDPCVLVDNNVTNEYELRNKGLRRCDDGSVSFVQPDSEGYNGWEGKCGQTAASNVLFHLCQTALSPEDDIDGVLSDLTPGVLPKTLRRGLTKIISKNQSYCPRGKWESHYTRNNTDFIKQVEKDLTPNYSTNTINVLSRNGQTRYTNPVITLIVDPGSKYLHWVTIVDIEKEKNSCHFYINHWSSQYRVPCDTFATWAGKVGKIYPIVLKSYTTVSFN